MVVKVYKTLDFCWYWSSTKLHWTKSTSTKSRTGTFSPSFILHINFFVLPNNFMASGVCNSSLYPSFILDSSLLLILLICIERLSVTVSSFYNILSIILNIWHWIGIIRQFKLIISSWYNYFEVITFVLLSYILPHVIYRQVLKSSMFIRTFPI